MSTLHQNHGLGSLFQAFSAVVVPGPAREPLSGAATRHQVLAEAAGSEPSRLWLRVGTWLTRAGEVVLAWHQRVATRRELMRLDEHVLQDIGLSPADVEAEWRKPFWRA